MTERIRVFKGERLKDARQKAGLSQAELAYRLGMGQNQIYRYETGEAEPSPVHMAALANELNVTTDWLLGLTSRRHARTTEGELTPDEQELLAAFRRKDLKDIMMILAKEAADT